MLEAGQRLYFGRARQSNGVTDWRAMNVLDAGDDEADFTGSEHVSLMALGRKYTDAVGSLCLTNGFGDDLIALVQGAGHDAYQRHHAEVIVEPGVDDQRL